MTVGQLLEVMTWSELRMWNDFFLDRQDEERAAERRAKKGKDTGPALDPASMTPDQFRTVFGIPTKSKGRT